MKPSFQLVHQHYPKVGKREELYPLIGWTDLTDNPVFLDTCAIRMSMALLGAGVTLPGARMVANDGTLKGKRIEPGQARLSGILKRIWAILKYSWMRAVRRRASAAGAARFPFFRIHSAELGGGRHIDLLWPAAGGFYQCARSCYFSAAETWFWPLR